MFTEAYGRTIKTHNYYHRAMFVLYELFGLLLIVILGNIIMKNTFINECIGTVGRSEPTASTYFLLLYIVLVVCNHFSFWINKTFAHISLIRGEIPIVSLIVEKRLFVIRYDDVELGDSQLP